MLRDLLWTTVMAGVLLPAGPIRAEGIAVIPAGEGEAFEPTVAVARAVVDQLRSRRRKIVARLAYPLQPDSPDAAQEKQAERLLEKGRLAYDRMEYEKVKRPLREALKLQQQQLKQHRRSEGYVRCRHLLAAAALMQGESKEALAHLQDAMLFDPRPPSKRDFSPAVRELFEKAQAATPGDGSLVFSSSSAILLWVDGTLRGLARGEVSLPPGLHLVEAYRPGYALWQSWVRLSADASRSLSLTLEPSGTAEPELLTRARGEARAPRPGAATRELTAALRASELILVLPEGTCSPARCTVALRWSRAGAWADQRSAPVGKNLSAVAARLLQSPVTPRSAAIPKAVASKPFLPTPSCEEDLDCQLKQRCHAGRCVTPTPLVRRWWFWSLIGVGAAGVALAIVLPLSRSGPQAIIEVR